MLANRDLREFSLHDSTLTAVAQHGGEVCIELDDVHADAGPKHAKVLIAGVRSVLRPGQEVGPLRMESGDGELLSLREEGGSVILVIQWNDFAEKRQDVVVYTLLGGKITRID